MGHDPLVDRVVTTIAEAFDVQRIVLFGSRAQGSTDPTAGIDLVIVYAGPKPKRELQVEIHRLFLHRDFWLDVFVLTREEFEAQQGIANTLAREVSEAGVVCYRKENGLP